MLKRLAIVSSYNTVCGNASYTHVLKEALAAHYDTDVIAINHKLLSNAHPVAKALAAAHIKEVAQKLSQYDYVNIQFEASLYGHSLGTAYENILPLIKASRSLLFTFHRIQDASLQSPLWKTAIRNNKNVRKTLQTMWASRQAQAFDNIVKALKNHQQDGHVVAALVHTPREREMLKLYYDFHDVIDFPLTFLTETQIDDCTSNRQAIRQKVFKKYTLDPDAKYIGIFGFLSENKGHHIAVNALKFLPPNYKLAIFGAQHPLSIKEYDLSAASRKPELFQENNSAYISSLIDLVEEQHAGDIKNGVHYSPDQQRVRFLGSLNDPDFIDAITAMDFVAVPYFETGQGGSGNASLALELGAKCVFSRTFAFMDLAYYYPDCFEMSDIANAPELAQRIYTWNKDVGPAQKRATSVFCIKNNALIHKQALESGAQSAQNLKASMLSGT